MPRLAPIAPIVIFFLTGLLCGCRDGISAGGHRASLFLVPLYQRPAGYSSSYDRHLHRPQPILITGEASPNIPQSEDAAVEQRP